MVSAWTEIAGTVTAVVRLLLPLRLGCPLPRRRLLRSLRSPARWAAWLGAALLKASTACARTVKLIAVPLFPATAFVLLLALVCFGESSLGAVCQLAGDKCAGTGGALESRYPVPSELGHLDHLIHFQGTTGEMSLALGNGCFQEMIGEMCNLVSKDVQQHWWVLSVLKWALSNEMGQILENPSGSGLRITGGHLLLYTWADKEKYVVFQRDGSLSDLRCKVCPGCRDRFERIQPTVVQQ